MQQRPATRIQPLRAMRAMWRLLRDPNDTEQVFEIIGALGARATRRMVKRMRATEHGTRLLDERPDLLSVLYTSRPEDFAPGTLGAEYHAFLVREGITTDGLIAVSDPGTRDLDDADIIYLSQRMTQQHDLWHALVGFQGDLIGEMALLAFTFAQTRNPGVAMIVGTLYTMAAGRLGVRPLVREAYRRGKRAARLVEIRWEDQLHRPLDELRAELGVGEPQRYVPVRTADLGPKGLLGPVPHAS